MRGVKPTIVQTSNDSVRVIGRDYATTCLATGTATGWTPIAGIPLTPAAFEASVLRNYCQMYNKFKINAMRFHYITASPTSTNGDVLFEIQKNRTDPLPNYSSSSFLPFALSDPHTVIGPQWTNHTVTVTPKGPLRTLVPGSNVDLDYQAQGEMWLFSKTSSTMNPGYVVVDYDITFAEQGLNPRYRALPNADFMYKPIQLYFTASSKTANSTTVNGNIGTSWSGGVAISNAYSAGEETGNAVYKFVLDWTNTKSNSWTATAGTLPTASTFAVQKTLNSSTYNAVTLKDGFTCYMRIDDATNTALYATIADAQTSSNPLLWANTVTPGTYTETANVPTAGIWLFGLVSLVTIDDLDDLQHS